MVCRNDSDKTELTSKADGKWRTLPYANQNAHNVSKCKWKETKQPKETWFGFANTSKAKATLFSTRTEQTERIKSEQNEQERNPPRSPFDSVVANEEMPFTSCWQLTASFSIEIGTDLSRSRHVSILTGISQSEASQAD